MSMRPIPCDQLRCGVRRASATLRGLSGGSGTGNQQEFVGINKHLLAIRNKETPAQRLLGAVAVVRSATWLCLDPFFLCLDPTTAACGEASTPHATRNAWMRAPQMQQAAHCAQPCQNPTPACSVKRPRRFFVPLLHPPKLVQRGQGREVGEKEMTC